MLGQMIEKGTKETENETNKSAAPLGMSEEQFKEQHRALNAFYRPQLQECLKEMYEGSDRIVNTTDGKEALIRKILMEKQIKLGIFKELSKPETDEYRKHLAVSAGMPDELQHGHGRLLVNPENFAAL